jgi:hypothetical protein
VHGVFTQQIDTEFLACFSETEESVEGEHVGEDPPAFVVVDHFEELEG